MFNERESERKEDEEEKEIVGSICGYIAFEGLKCGTASTQITEVR